MFTSQSTIVTAPRKVMVAGLLCAAGFAQAGGALTLSREVEVDASPATVWKMIGNFNHLDVWHPALSGSAVQGAEGKVGSVRTLVLTDGAKITEKLTARSDAKMSYSYVILTGPLPVQHYESTLTVVPNGAGKSKVTWMGSFDAKGAPEDKAKDVIQGVYDAGLAKVVANFKK